MLLSNSENSRARSWEWLANTDPGLHTQVKKKSVSYILLTKYSIPYRFYPANFDATRGGIFFYKLTLSSIYTHFNTLKK